MNVHPAHFGCQVFTKFIKPCRVVWPNLYLVVGPPTRLVVLKVHSGLTRKTTNLVNCKCGRQGDCCHIHLSWWWNLGEFCIGLKIALFRSLVHGPWGHRTQEATIAPRAFLPPRKNAACYCYPRTQPLVLSIPHLCGRVNHQRNLSLAPVFNHTGMQIPTQRGRGG